MGRSREETSELEEKIAHKLNAARADLIEADRLTERAAMATFDVFHLLKFGRVALSINGEAALESVDKAHDHEGGARGELGDAVYQIEKVLKRIES